MYKVQRGLIIGILLILSFAFYGCSSSMHSENVQDKLGVMIQKLKSYEADATITFFRDTGMNVIKMKQAAEIGGKYKLTVESPDYLKGLVTYYDGKDIYQYDPHTKINVSCKPSEARNQTMLSYFAEDYLNTEKAKMQNETLSGEKAVTCEVPIAGNYQYMAKKKVWFNDKNLLPVKMEIYDIGGNTTLQILFEHFKYNSQINF